MVGWAKSFIGSLVGRSLAMWPKEVPASRKKRFGKVWVSTEQKYRSLVAKALSSA